MSITREPRTTHFSDRELDSILLKLIAVSASLANDMVAEWDGALVVALLERARARNIHILTARVLRGLSGIAEYLRRDARTVELLAINHDLSLVRCLSDVVGAFRELNIEYLVHKGPVLWRALGMPGPTKCSGDIDVFVQPEDLVRASAVLSDIGYSCTEIDGREATYVSDGPFAIDLHWGLLTVGNWADRLDGFLREAWDRRVSVDVEGMQISSFSPTDTVFALALHAGCHHVCEEWSQICELALCANALGDRIDWDHLVRMAEAVGLRCALYCPCHLAVNWFGARIPGTVIDKTRPPFYRQGLDWIANAAFAGRIKTYPAHRVARFAWNLLLQPGVREMARWAVEWAACQGRKRCRVSAMDAFPESTTQESKLRE